MNFIFRYSKQTEIERLIFTYSSLTKGIYQKLGFLLLTEYIPQNNLPNVIIPNTKFKLTSEVSKMLSKANICIGKSIKNEVINKFFNKKFQNIDLIKTSKLEEFENNWKKIEKDYIKIFETIFPDDRINKIVIIPTKYGTNGSYHLEGKDLFINIRMDQDIKYVIALITKALVHNSIIKKEVEYEEHILNSNEWNKKEEFADYLMQNTNIKTIYPNYVSTIENLKNQEINLNLIKTSNTNYAEIGFPSKPLLKLNGYQIKFSEIDLKNLTQTQNKILITLLKEEGKIITNEEIAEIMWGKDYYDKFSLSAMAKMIHQLRQKLKDAGLQKEVIFTKRGKGYVLVQ